MTMSQSKPGWRGKLGKFVQKGRKAWKSTFGKSGDPSHQQSPPSVLASDEQEVEDEEEGYEYGDGDDYYEDYDPSGGAGAGAQLV